MNTDSTRILVVEDESQYRFLIQLNLEASGYTVALTEDGRSGLEQVIRQEPDLILLDVMLPDIDGIQLCRKIRQFSTVPIVMLTARAEKKDVIAGLNAGADDYVTKPFGVDELARHLGHVVSATHLLDVVWGPGYEDATKTLHQSIYRLRHKIERDPSQPQHLLNRSGQGYLLVSAETP